MTQKTRLARLSVMRSFFAFAVVCLMGCSPLVQVVRVEKPRRVLAVGQQPVHLVREPSSSLVITVLELFADHSGDWLAIERLNAALVEAGVAVSETENAGVTLGVRLQTLTFEGQGEARRARAEISIVGLAPNALSRGEATVMKDERDDALARRAIDAAAASFADSFRTHEVTDSFWLSKREDLKAGNQLLHDGRIEEALASYRAVLDAKPDDLDALGNLVAALTAAGDLEEAARVAHRLADATTGAMHLNREQQAQAADVRAARTDRVLSFTVAK